MSAATALFEQQGSGNIINIASLGGLFSARAGAAYTASKHALVGLTKNTAFMYAEKIFAVMRFAPAVLSLILARESLCAILTKPIYKE